ncbi:MAG: VCBS repeat-containing protein [Armatimonadetes bacterium]|nr:VCBS repeat-containing protein [Armatimonadota bacterium]
MASVEDAVLVDLDRDGSPDVVSAAEGRTRSLFVHWAPTDAARLLDPIAWSTTPIPGSRGRMQWMFTLPLQLDGKHGPDLVAAGKNEGAELGWWEAPRDARNLAEWHWRRLRAVGWIMSLVGEDMDGDGDTDLLCSDRKGPSAGVFWLENPGLTRVAGEWVEHPVAAGGREAMFLAVSDFDGDGRRDVVAAVKDQELLLCRRLDGSGLRWDVSSVSLPGNTGGAKAVQAGDLDGDGRAELVFTCVGATNGRHGVMGLRRAPEGSGWVPVIIGGPDGVKHDLVELQDLDSDGDLDVLTCEETRNLGVFWYENPSRK